MVISHKMSENEMGYRGSKSEFLNPQPNEISVKEQRVDGSYFGISPKLRCTLTGGVSCYPFKILSKQLNRSSIYTLSSKPKLNPWFLTGFADAEGCFSISVQPSTRMKNNWRVAPVFMINLHKKDVVVLEDIKYTLSVGTIRKNGANMRAYIVESFRDIQAVVDHFDKYPLISAKISDFLLFKQCFEIIKQKKHLTTECLVKIMALKSSLNWGLSLNLKKAFPNVLPVNRPEYFFKGINDPFWVAGFTSGDGSFHIVTRNSDSADTGFKVMLRFSIKLNIREKELIKGLVSFFQNWKINTKVSNSSLINHREALYKNIYILESSVGLQITKISDIVNILIPFFEKYPIAGFKSLDFSDFKKLAIMIKNKEHLTEEGFKKILKIKSSMNQNRLTNNNKEDKV